MLLILREEIICAVILTFLIFYYSINKVKDKEMLFLKICSFGLLHVIFDIITVITVNNPAIVPDYVNRLMHICFYISGILFIQGFYNYIIHLTALYKHMRTLKALGYIPLMLFIILLIFLPMEYVEGNGTNYSFGPLAFAGYGIFMVYCLACMLMLIGTRNRLETKVKWALIPMIMVMAASVIMQALIPELLMTGGGITFVCLGMFVALDNPDKDFKKQALWDFLTGLKNRNCYDRDLNKYIHSNAYSKNRIGFVAADMNYLKNVNDTFGHAEGDKLICAAADILKEHLKSAESVYRIGGDEFVAIYISPSDASVSNEIAKVKSACLASSGYAVPFRIALGYSSGLIGENIDTIFQEADDLMYKDKTEMKKNETEIKDARG